MLMKGQKELKDMTSDKTYETLVLVKYFKLSVLMTRLIIFSVPDFVPSPEGESVYVDTTEHKVKTRLTRYLVSLLEVIFERLFYIFIASKYLSLFNG